MKKLLKGIIALFQYEKRRSKKLKDFAEQMGMEFSLQSW
jgi:hypothetical protein